MFETKLATGDFRRCFTSDSSKLNATIQKSYFRQAYKNYKSYADEKNCRRFSIPNWSSFRTKLFIHLPHQFYWGRTYKILDEHISFGHVKTDLNDYEIIRARNTKESPCYDNMIINNEDADEGR